MNVIYRRFIFMFNSIPSGNGYTILRDVMFNIVKGIPADFKLILYKYKF